MPDINLETIQSWFLGWYIWEACGRWHARRRDEYFEQEFCDTAPAYAMHASDLPTMVAWLTVESGCVLPDLVWECRLHRTEARWLAGEYGPLGRSAEGFIAWEGGDWVTMDDAAFQALKALGERDRHQDGRITYHGQVPCVTFGRDTYPVRPLGAEPSPDATWAGATA